MNKVPILIFLMISIIHASTKSFSNSKFGLLTVTHSRDHDFSVILKYLQLYAQGKCYTELISEIFIIWNNVELPEDVGIFERQQHWLIPVHIHQTPYNSLNHRFRVPAWANSSAYYSLDDDIIADCQTLNRTYARFLQASDKRVGRIVSNEVRSFGFFDNKYNEFFYQGHSTAFYFTIAETGASFYPEHYLDLYYLMLDEIKQLREAVEKITSCEDIFFMAVSQHYYPQAAPLYEHPQIGFKNTDPTVGLSKKSGLVPLRTSCISLLSEIFGYNPLRLYSKNSQAYLNNWKFRNMDEILQTKYKGMIESGLQIIQQQPNQNTVDIFKIPNHDPITSHNSVIASHPPINFNQTQNKSAFIIEDTLIHNSSPPSPHQIQSKQTSIHSTSNNKQTMNNESVVTKQQAKSMEKSSLRQKQISSANIFVQLNNKDTINYIFWLILIILITIILLLLLFIRKLFRTYQSLRQVETMELEQDEEIIYIQENKL